MTYKQKEKKSGHPTQPGSHSNAPEPIAKERKRSTILYRVKRFFKRLNWAWIALIVLDIISLCIVLWWALDTFGPAKQTQAPAETRPVYLFSDNAAPVNMQGMTEAWAAEAKMEKRYDLTDAERWEVASVVTAEAEGEPFAGKVGVAQCILQACEDDGIRPAEALVKYSYAKTRPEPTEEALDAVQDVFDFGHVATTEPIKYFYAPARCQSEWHESQDFVLQINGHKFFKEAE